MTDARVKAMVSSAVFRLLAIDLHAFEKNVALLLCPSTGELDERSHLPVEKAEGDPLCGMVVNTVPLEDALTLLRDCEMLDALREIEKSPMSENGRWAIVVTEEKTAILGFSAELTVEDKEAMAPGFNAVPLDQLASAPTDFQAWTVRQLERDIPRLVRRHPTFAADNQQDTIVCCIARGSVLDELIHPEIRMLMARRGGGDQADCFPTHAQRVFALLAKYAMEEGRAAFSAREAAETASSIRTQLAALRPGELVALHCRGKHVAVSRFSWTLEEIASEVQAPEKRPAEPVVNAKGGSC